MVGGSAPYAADYTAAIDALAAADERIRLLGAVYDQDLLDALYHHAFTYLHGHSVGGTNPSLLRAMGAGTAVIAHDVVFNREVLDGNGWFFSDAADVAEHVVSAEADPASTEARATAVQEIARTRFRWDDVADEYEALAHRIAERATIHPSARRACRRSTDWVPAPAGSGA